MLVDISNPELYNEVYIPSIFTNHRYKIYYGSRDSGKTYAIAQKVIYHLMNEDYCKVCLIRKTAASIGDSMYSKILAIIDYWNIRSLFKITKSPMKIICKKTGNTIIAKGLDDPEKTKSLDDPTIIWIEEATDVTLHDFITIDQGIRSSYSHIDLQMILSFNPIVEESWINEYFFPPKNNYEKEDGMFHEVKSIRDDTYILHTTYKDNKLYKGDDKKEALMDGLLTLADKDYHRVSALGLWGAGKHGIIFTNVSYEDEMPGIENGKFYGFGMDFGFTNDPTSIVECCLGPGGKIYAKELTYETGLVNVAHGSEISIHDEFVKHEITSNFDIIADSAEPKSIKELKNAGHNVIGVKKGKGSVDYGIELLRKYEIVVCGASPNLKRELKNLCWKHDKEGRATNKPEDGNDHCIDAIRYWAMHYLGKNQAISSGIIGGMF